MSRGTQVFTRSLFGFAYKAFTFCGGPLPGPSTTKKVYNFSSLKTGKSYNPPLKRGLGLSLFARRYLGNRILLSIPPLTKMFQFRKFPPHRLFIRRWVSLKEMGCPIRKSSGRSLLSAHRSISRDYYVLHRPREPRHPPNALIRFFSQSDSNQPQEVSCYLTLLLSSCQGAKLDQRYKISDVKYLKSDI